MIRKSKFNDVINLSELERYDVLYLKDGRHQYLTITNDGALEESAAIDRLLSEAKKLNAKEFVDPPRIYKDDIYIAIPDSYYEDGK